MVCIVWSQLRTHSSVMMLTSAATGSSAFSAFLPHPLFPLTTKQHNQQPICSTPSFPTRQASIALLAAAITLSSLPQTISAYGLQDGRLEKCKGDLPCISTSSVGNPSKFGPPWTYEPQTSDADVAWESLKKAVADSKDRGTIVESVDGPDKYYLRAEFPSYLKGIDDVEFRLIKRDALVTYRSCSREAIYLYPIQTPINTDKNRTRLLDIRNVLGWEEFAGFNIFGNGDL